MNEREKLNTKQEVIDYDIKPAIPSQELSDTFNNCTITISLK